MVTAAGADAPGTWDAVVGGGVPAGVGPHPQLAGLNSDFAYTVRADLAARLGVAVCRLMDRFAQFAVIAAREAVADAGLDKHAWVPTRVGVVIGNGHGGLPFYDEQHARLLTRRRVSPKTGLLTPATGATTSVTGDLGVSGPSFAMPGISPVRPRDGPQTGFTPDEPRLRSPCPIREPVQQRPHSGRPFDSRRRHEPREAEAG